MRPYTQYMYIKALNRIVGYLGEDRDVRHVYSLDIKGYQAYRLKEAELRTVNNELQIGGTFWNYLLKHTDVLDVRANPFLPIPDRKRKYNIEAVDDETVQLLRDNVKTPTETLILELFLSTPFSSVVISDMTKDDADLEARTIKGIPASDRLLKLFEALPPGRLVRKEDRRASVTIANICKRAGIKPVHVRAFQRTYATKSIEKGIPVHTLQKLMGHKRLETTIHFIAPSIMAAGERIELS